MWLDVARYGEDDYRSLDPQGRGLNPYPNAYLYRDWVIKAFNDDLPYDQFVKAQLAADLMDESLRVRNLPALGFSDSVPGITTTARSRSRAPTNGTIAWMRSAAASSVSPSAAPVATITSTIRFRRRDYYALAGVFLNTEYHEYPLAPKALVEDFKAQEKKIEKKQELLGTFLFRTSRSNWRRRWRSSPRSTWLRPGA